ncbi:MAG: F0F1 ATP synthase subunit A [Actinobacteria bacterium]|nr:F0F1 ATP synthase subunit A [Actinomycetota bacterium]
MESAGTSHGHGNIISEMLEEFNLQSTYGQHFFGIDLSPLSNLHLFGLDLSVNKAVVCLWLSTLITFGIIYYAGHGRGLVATGFRNMIEAIFTFIKLNVVEEALGHEGKKWLPFIGGLFFFILINNLIGLIPGSFAPTSNINVTAALAILVFIIFLIAGMIKQGPFKYWAHLAPGGLPKWMYVVLYPIEIITLFMKPLSLAIRLFANMLAGHIVIFSLLALIILFKMSLLMAPLPFLASVIMYAFEIFVALIQAYIFTILSAIYIGSAMHPEH